MASPKVNSKRVMRRANVQLEGFKKRPDLEKGLPCTVDGIHGSMDVVDVRAKELESAKNAVHAAVLALNAAAGDLRGMIAANIAVAAMLHGNQSDAVAFLGGATRRGGRRKGGATPTDAPKADTTPSDATAHAA